MKKWLQVALLFLCAGIPVMGQSFALNEGIGNYPSLGIGMNTGEQNFYNSYILKNTASVNPGMQPTVINTVMTLSGGSATTFTDSNPFTSFATNQFQGCTYEGRCAANKVVSGLQVCSGGSTGRTGTVTSSTAATGSVGATLTVASGTAFTANDTVIVKCAPKASPSANDFNNFGWTGGAVIDTTSGDLPPPDVSGATLTQIMSLAAGQSMTTAFDTTSGLQYYAFNGGYGTFINYKVKAGTSCTIPWSVHRSITGGINASGSIAATADGQWHTGSTSFTGSEPDTIASNPNVQITYGASGSGCTILIFGSQVYRTADTNASVYRDHTLLTDYGTINPAELRYWGGQNPQTLNNWIATQNYRFQAEATVTNLGGTQQGLYDFLNMAALQGRKAVEIVVPITFNNTDAANLVDFIAGGSGTTYGAKRIALGTTAPFNTLITRITLEYGNEEWNNAAANEAIPSYSTPSAACATTSGTCWNYLPLVTSFCTAMKADANWDTAHMFCAAGMPAGPGESQFYTQLSQQIDTAHKIDAYAINQYTIQSPTSCSTTNLYQTWWMQYYQNTHNSSDSQGWYQAAVQAATTGATAYPYEYQNNLTGGGSCTSSQIAGQAEGLGEALADVLGPAWDEQVFGTKDATFFTTYQPNYGANNIWGIMTGPGGAYQNPRVAAQAIGMFNNCAAGATGYTATGTSIPTFNFTSINGLLSQSNVPTVFALPFKSGTTRCIALFNMDPTTSRTVSFTGASIPTGSVTEVLLTSANVTDNNEGANAALVVAPATSVVSSPGSFTLAAHSMMTITWTVGGALGPPIKFSGQYQFSGAQTFQ